MFTIMQAVYFLLLICALVGKIQGKKHFYLQVFSNYKPSKMSHVSIISVKVKVSHEQQRNICSFLLLFAKRISGETLTITTKFINGDVIFAWTGSSSKGYYVYIKKDGIKEPAEGRDSYNETSRTIENALLYDSLELVAAIPGGNTLVKTYKGNSLTVHSIFKSVLLTEKCFYGIGNTSAF